MDWSYAWAIEPGNGKAVSQDAAVCFSLEEGLVLAVADGAGSAARGGEGAQIVCRLFSELASQFLLEDARGLLVERFLSEIRGEPATFATTFLGAILLPERLLVLHIGDGAAVAGVGSCLKVVSSAAETEFVNVTRFVTDANALDHFHLGWIEEPFDRICLMTDGLQPLVVDDRTGEPHPPFFERVFQALSPQPGFDTRAAGWLSTVLKGDSVRTRTDDDTTIVLAKRNP